MNISFVVSMLVFAFTIYLVFKHPMIKIPFTPRYVEIDYGLAPLIGAVILLATLSADFNTVVRGIMGGDGIKPYSILLLIMSLSYICVSLDFTGFFEYLSLRVVRASGDSGNKLFVFLFLLSAFLTLFTNNDIVILTTTPIIFYVATNAGLNPIPFLFSQFFITNIIGMTLYIGNPTNIIAADSYGLSFVEYAKWMALPSILAGASCFLLLRLLFRKMIPKKYKRCEVDPRSALKDKDGALFGSVVLACTIFFLSLPSSWIGLPLWARSLFFASLVLLRDIISHRSKISAIVSRMPWKIVPFLIGLFIIVESLASSGWTDLFSCQLSKISKNLGTATFGVCFLSSLAAGVMNNHTMTIFFVRALQGSCMTPQIELSSILALIAGSNFGANFTIIGSLAGIMWAKALFDKKCIITFSEFSKYGLFIMPFVVVVTSLALMAELMIWGPR